jgi:hypothetical protein
MNNFTASLAKIVGTSHQNSWSQVHTFFPDDIEKKDKRGIFLGVFAFKTENPEIDAVTFGREILSRIHEEYYGETETPALSSLEKAVGKVVEEFSQEGSHLEILVAVILKNILYLVSSGDGRAYLKRGDLWQKILEGGQKEVETASGYLEDSDNVVLGTSTFFNLVTDETLKKALESGIPQEAADGLTPFICSQSEDSQVAAIIGKIGEEELITDSVQEVSEEEPVLEKEIPPKKENPLLDLFRKFTALYPQKIEIKLPSGEEGKKKKVVFTVAILLIILLGISIFFGKEKSKTAEKQKQFDSLYQEARKNLEEGTSLVSLNPIQAKELIFQARDIVPKIEKLQLETDKVQQLKQEIDNALGLVVKEHVIDNPTVSLDLALFRANGKGDFMSSVGNNLAVLDTQESVVFGVEMIKKSGSILAGSDTVGGARAISSYDDKVFVLDDNGITQITQKTKKLETVVKKENITGEVRLMKAFAGNLYLIDNQDIWRFNVTDTGFGPQKKWLAEGQTVDFSKVKSMAIDGSIWILDSSGKILKFVQGAPAGFSVKGLDKPLSGQAVIYTDYDSQNLYVLDRGNKRIVVINKTGEYQEQFLWDGFSDATDLVVSEANNSLYFLSGSKIYQISLK